MAHGRARLLLKKREETERARSVCDRRMKSNTVYSQPTSTKQSNAGLCRPPVIPAVYADASVTCPDGFEMEKNKMGLVQCVKRTLQPCPEGYLPGSDGTCCPADPECVLAFAFLGGGV
jgi:hypothetical protein